MRSLDPARGAGATRPIARAGDGDPAGTTRRRRGRARRHAGERRLAAGREGTGYAAERDRLVAARRSSTAGPIDPESGQVEPPPRQADRARAAEPLGPAGAVDGGDGPRRRPLVGRPGRARAAATGRSAARRRDLSDWERWLEFCARIDGFPRHLSIHSGGMLVTAAPLIDIAPLERATMPDRVVVQFDKRDVETLKLIKLDLLGLGMLAAIDETLQLIEHDCAVCVDLDRLPEEIPEVFEMLQAADTVGVFQVESRAQMQTLPKSRPASLDDLVVEVAIIRPGPIQGNAVHPYLRRKQGLEPVTYLHPSLEPVLRDSMGVILYQEQVMRIAIEVAGFSPADSDGFRRAMGTWRSTREMEKLHQQFVDGCMRQPGMTEEVAEELFRQVAAFARFGFAKSHAAAFARTAYESSFLKLFYPAQFLVGLINAQPMGFYPVEVLVNDAKRHGVAVLPVDVNRSRYKTTTEWVGRPGWATAGRRGRATPRGRGHRPAAGSGPVAGLRDAVDRGPRALGDRRRRRLGRPPRAGARQGDRRGARGAPRSRSWSAARIARWPTSSSGPGSGGDDRAAHPGRGARFARAGRGASCSGSCARSPARSRPVDGRSSGRRVSRRRTADGPAAAADRGADPAPASPNRSGSATPTRSSGSTPAGRWSRSIRPALDGSAPSRTRPSPSAAGPVRIGGLVVTRQHPMTAKGTVFLALEDETGHGQRHALAGHLGAAARRRPAPRAAARRRRPPAGVVGRQRHRPRRPAAHRGRRRRGCARAARWRPPARPCRDAPSRLSTAAGDVSGGGPGAGRSSEPPRRERSVGLPVGRFVGLAASSGSRARGSACTRPPRPRERATDDRDEEGVRRGGPAAGPSPPVVPVDRLLQRRRGQHARRSRPTR